MVQTGTVSVAKNTDRKINRQRTLLPATLERDIEFLDHAYPEIDIEFVHLIDKFSPELIQRLSKQWNIPANLMFIGSPGGRWPYDLGEPGGVRLII